MDPTSDVGLNPKPMRAPTRAQLLSRHLKGFLDIHHLLHPEKAFTEDLQAAERRANMSHSGMLESGAAPAEQYEPIQRATSVGYNPHPERSLPLNKHRQSLVDDIIALYSCQPTVQRVKRYTPDCVYDDQFVYVDDRYEVAEQWFALPKLFKNSVNDGYKVIRSDAETIQFKNKQSYTFRQIPKIATITSLVSLTLDPASRDSHFMQIKYHKDQLIEEDDSQERLGFLFKKWQADNVVKFVDEPELKEFVADRGVGKGDVRRYGNEEGTERHDFARINR